MLEFRRFHLCWISDFFCSCCGLVVLGFLNAQSVAIEELKHCSRNERETDQDGIRCWKWKWLNVNSDDDKIIQAQQSDRKLHDDCYISSLSEESQNSSHCL
jgi:hypothetical protein